MSIHLYRGDAIVFIVILITALLGVLTSRHLINKKIKPILEFLLIGLLCAVGFSYFLSQQNITVITFKELGKGYFAAFTFQTLYQLFGPVPLFQKIFSIVTGVKIEWKNTDNNSKKD